MAGVLLMYAGSSKLSAKVRFCSFSLVSCEWNNHV